MRLEQIQKKAGVSLVTVLLFMLVATIAATATYKWLTSEGHSSASRMMKKEAYQSSIAGIENARAWMTFHANETGALIKQYIYDADGKPKTTKTPINIDAQLQQFAQGSLQDHHVWLVGVNTEDPTYKVKILSEGISRNGRARHTEVAIFNVDGLYRVNKPKQEEEGPTIPFEYAYFGGSYNAAGPVTISSAVINGNWQGNPQNVQGNFVVTGDADLSGNDISVGPLACIGGNARFENQGISVEDLYVDGNTLSMKAAISGNAYFGGNVTQGSTGAIDITGNVTVNGKFKANLATTDYYVTIGGNLCTGENGVIYYNDKNPGASFTVNGDVWMPGDINLWYGKVDGSQCTCYKNDYVCTYKKCTCKAYSIGPYWIPARPCKETDWQEKTCVIEDYAGECNAESNGKWISQTGTLVGDGSMYAFYKLSATSKRVEGTVSCLYNATSMEMISCDDYELFLEDPPDDDINNNYKLSGEYRPIKFALGGEGSSVHIKSAYSSQEYIDDLQGSDKTFTQTQDAEKPRACKNGTQISPYVCNEYDNGWDNASHQPYKQSVTQANDLYYIYSMPEGREDIDFGTYWDSKWNKTFSGYFVDFASKEKTYVFTTSSTQTTCPDENRPVKDGDKCYRYLNHTHDRITGSPYCKLNRTTTPKKKWQPICGVNPWFRSAGTVSRNMSGTRPACGETVKTKCDAIWKLQKGCDGAKYFVKDPIVTAKNVFESYASKGCAANITEYGANYVATTGGNLKRFEAKDEDGNTIYDSHGNVVYEYKDVGSGNGDYVNNNDLVKALNDCYEENVNDDVKKKENLYNGFLVVKLSGGTTSTNPNGKLDGKFIIIAEDPLYTSFMDTEDDAYVFYYLENGTTEISGATRKNTFIYTDGQLGTGSQFNLTGTIYASATSCSGMKKLQNSTLTYDPNLIKILNKAHIICENDGSACGSTSESGGSGGGTGGESGGTGGESGGSGSGSSGSSGGMDVNFISNAPQLGVTLESQYETSEAVPTGDNIPTLAPSFIVLPRIIFLNRDPAGKLSDYYNVVPLNGANVNKSTATVSCTPSLNVGSSDLVSDGSKLDEGIYRCAASALSKRDSFWVWVEGTRSSSPQISFVEQSKKLVPGEPYEVKINLPAHSAALDVKIDATSFPSGWTVTSTAENSSTPYTFHFNVNASDDTPTLFTVTPPSNAENGSITFTIQPGEGYQRNNPSTTNLLIASSVTLTNSFAVTVTDINAWCTSHSSECPSSSLRSSWPSCPNADAVEWVVPDWGKFTTIPGSKNTSWSILTSNTGTLRLKEKAGNNSNCVVIIPETNNSYPAPIVSDPEEPYTLRAIAKAKSHTLTLQFVGDVGTANPFVYYKPGNRSEETCYYDDDNSNHRCSITVFDGESVQLRIDNESVTGKAANKEFNYWQCSGASCPKTDPVSSVAFNAFHVSDNGTVVNIHFGERDKHCFFDEFRKTLAANTTHSCAYSGEEENVYCIGTGDNAKWKMVTPSEIIHVEKEPYQGYVVAAKGAPSTGVKVMSTVEAGVHGHLRALFQLPHATASYDEKSPKIKNSGFLLRANSAGTQFFMLNVYANASGNLEAQLCLDGGPTCLDPVEFKRNYSSAYVSTSSMVMLFATFNDANTLTLKAFTGNYYNTETINDDAYTAELNLSGLGTSRADFTYQYVGFSLASRDFKVYGIGWESIDYAQECFDGPPAVRCSFAAVAQNGIIPTYGTLAGQSEARQKPWVGHSGWFDSKGCAPVYSYVTKGTSDADVSATDGYQFNQSGAGAHGYKDAGEDVKTAYAALNGCKAAGTETQAWASTTPAAHCGPFWTGKLTACENDAALLPDDIAEEGGRSVVAGEIWPLTFTSKNLRGVERGNGNDFGGLIITLANDFDDEVKMEVWLESKSTEWGGVDYESRHVLITGNQKQIVQTFNVDSDFGDNATGFDPENVVAIKFKNNGDYAVTVKDIKAECKNAVKFNGCSLSSEGSSWIITIDAGANSNKITSVSVSGTGDLSKTVDCSTPNSNCFEITVPDPNFYKNAGTAYEFSATVNATGGYHKTETCTCASSSCSPTAITCTPTAITSTIKGGDSWPNFKFTLAGCPADGCDYSVYLSSDQSAFATKTGAEDKAYNHQYPTGKIPECETEGGCSYTYEVKSDNAAKPFGECKTTFTVQQKGKENLILSCSLDNQSNQTVGSELSTSGSVSATSGCGTGETCTWTIKNGDDIVGSGTLGQTPYTFDGSLEAGTYSYVFTVTRTSDNATASCDAFTVSYPLNLSCGNDYSNPGATTPIPVGDPVTLPTVSGTNSGCNGKCTYTITGGGLSNVGGNYTDNMTFSTFSDQNATGTGSSFNVNYALNIYKGGSQPVLSCSPLTVTYASGGSGDAFTCTYSAKVQGGISNQNLSASKAPHAEYDLYIDDAKEKTAWNDDNGNAPGFNFTTPTKLGIHTYKVTKKGESDTQCHGSFEVVNPLLCEIENEVVLNTPNTFKVSVMEYKENNAQVFTCSNCTYTNVDCGSSCGGVGINDYTFTLNSYVPKELKVTCQCNPGNVNPVCTKVAAVKHAPEIDCDALKTAAASGGAGTGLVISPTVIGCAGNCSYTIVGGSTNINHSTADWTSGTAMTALSSESASSTPVSYTLTVTNDVNPYTDVCTFKTTYSSVIPVNAKGKTYDIVFEPGKTYSVTINTGGNWRCTVPSNTSYSRPIGTFNDKPMSIDSWQTQSNTISSPGAGTIATFVIESGAPAGLRCDTDHY